MFMIQVMLSGLPLEEFAEKRKRDEHNFESTYHKERTLCGPCEGRPHDLGIISTTLCQLS